MSRSPKSSLDRVITSVPQDATAARVTSKGTHYSPDIQYDTIDHRDIRPPIVAPDQIRHAKGAAFARSIIGKRIGRLVVVGLAAEQNDNVLHGPGSKKKRSRWVVRCDCGDYEFRKAKSIVAGNEQDCMCKRCHDLEWKKEQYRKLGSRSVEEFTNTPPQPRSRGA